MNEEETTSRLLHRVQELEAAIRKHRDQKGHDRCWLNDLELYGVLGEPVGEPCLPPTDEFLSRCREYEMGQRISGIGMHEHEHTLGGCD